MKLPKSTRSALREIDRVVAKVMKSVDTNRVINDQENIERLLDGVILQVAKNRSLDIDQILLATNAVIQAMPEEYGGLDDNLKGWETLIAFLYLKYHQVLGIDTSMFE